ncbi:MAG: hypothetical protein ACLT98_06945 [Eggerthellaceae bacterium]
MPHGVRALELELIDGYRISSRKGADRALESVVLSAPRLGANAGSQSWRGREGRPQRVPPPAPRRARRLRSAGLRARPGWMQKLRDRGVLIEA